MAIDVEKIKSIRAKIKGKQMKSKNIAVLVFSMSLFAFGTSVYADEGSMNNAKDAVEHPETTLHAKEASAANTNVQEFQQQKKETKAQMDQAKKDYEKSLADNGADSEITKDAKKRLTDVRKEYRKYAKKTAQATSDLKEDTQMGLMQQL